MGPPVANSAMATLPTNTVWLRRGAFAAGLVAAATVAILGRLPAPHPGPLPAQVKLTTMPTGELAVEPVGPVAEANGLVPGEGALRARITLQSQVAAPLTVRVRQRPSLGDADSALRVSVRSGATRLYEGAAGGLRRPSPGAVRIPARGTVDLEVRAWLPDDAPAGWSGRRVTLPLEYVSSIRGKVRR